MPPGPAREPKEVTLARMRPGPGNFRDHFAGCGWRRRQIFARRDGRIPRQPSGSYRRRSRWRLAVSVPETDRSRDQISGIAVVLDRIDQAGGVRLVVNECLPALPV
jgi:hypothetical protein